MTLDPTPTYAYLRGVSASLVLDWSDSGIPVIVHWGRDLGSLSGEQVRELAHAARPAVDTSHSPERAVRPRLVMLESDAWKGRPGLAGYRGDGSGWSPVLRLAHAGVEAPHSRLDEGVVLSGSGGLRFSLVDEPAKLRLDLVVEMLPTDLIHLQATLHNDAGTDYHLDELSLSLPIGLSTGEFIDFTGNWSRERIPVRSPIGPNAHVHESRHGRPGFGAAPMLLCGERGFDFAAGLVHGVHVAFSGNHRTWIESSIAGPQILSGGELLLPGEIKLEPFQSYTTPRVFFAVGEGMDSVAHHVHDWLRSRPRHPDTRRKVTLNVWEAVYFDHDLPRLLALADRAAQVGVERFVLDDGWFTGRRDGTAGLGDWEVDATVWPNGLHPLIDHVRRLGMEFGLWVEPEMVNPRSQLAREHPEWVMRASEETPVAWRDQQVLNLTIAEAFTYVHDSLARILDEYDISYLKWDHNRALISAGSALDHGRASVHEQTLAAYRLMDALSERRGGLEIESCASGGARIDLEMAEHVDRFWPSDNIDPRERQEIIRWTSQLLPLEMLGSHIAQPRSRTTGRASTLGFRAVTALFGHLGIEWDLTQASEHELDVLAHWVDYYRSKRDLLFTGRLYRRDFAGGAIRTIGVVASDRREALIAATNTERRSAASLPRILLPGLDDQTVYRVQVRAVEDLGGLISPDWFATGLTLTGRSLAEAGVALPQTFPDQTWLIEVNSDVGSEPHS